MNSLYRLLGRLVLFSLLGVPLHLCSQNLVLNPKFSVASTIPNYIHQIYYATNWSSPSLGTSDYFHSNNGISCAGNVIVPPGNSAVNYVSAPANTYGIQNDAMGATGDNGTHAYAGIGCHLIGGNDGREYIKGQLSQPLTAGTTYLVRYKVSMAEISTKSVASIGAYLSSTNVYSATSGRLPYTPQVVSGRISDMQDWVEVIGAITASGGEEYIVIGCFDNDLGLENVTQGTVNCAIGTNHSAFYYIDEVSVEAWQPSSTCCDMYKIKVFDTGNCCFLLEMFTDPDIVSSGCPPANYIKIIDSQGEVIQAVGAHPYDPGQMWTASRHFLSNLICEPGIYTIQIRNAAGGDFEESVLLCSQTVNLQCNSCCDELFVLNQTKTPNPNTGECCFTINIGGAACPGLSRIVIRRNGYLDGFDAPIIAQVNGSPVSLPQSIDMGCFTPADGGQYLEAEFYDANGNVMCRKRFFLSCQTPGHRPEVLLPDNPSASSLLGAVIENFRVSPNPARDILDARYTLGANSHVSAELWNHYGQRALLMDAGMQLKGEHSLSICTESLSSGFYNLRIVSSGFVHTIPVLILR